MSIKKRPHKTKTRLLFEQSGYSPASDDTFNPCTMAQFDLNCVYAGRKLATGRFAYPGGSSLPEFPPVTSASVACGANGYSAVANPPQPCLYYDTISSKYMIYDTNLSGTNDCSTPGGCNWGDTVTFANGDTSLIQFIGYECDAGVCTEYNTGNATYNTDLICQSSGCGGSTGVIGCADPFSYDWDSTHTGCDTNSDGVGDPADVACCTYLTGCMDNRVDGNGNFLATNTGWPNGIGPVSVIGAGAIVADNNNVVQLDDDTATPWGFPAATINQDTFGNCTYPTPNNNPVANGCTNPLATNYLSTYVADCAAVPILISSDPFYFGASVNDDCCTINQGCMDNTACNYDDNATVDDGSCETLTCRGCMDPISLDYNNVNFISVPGVDLQLDCSGNQVTSNTGGTPFGNDQCCNYMSGCMDFVGSTNAVPSATSDCQGNEIITGLDLVNDPTLVTPYYDWPSFNNTNGGTAVGPGATVMSDGSACCSAVIIPIEGCLDSDSLNYNSGADGCPGMDPASTDPSNLDGYGNLDAANNSCCLYNTYCQDTDANNDAPDVTGAFPCNDVDFGPDGLYYGETGFQPIYPGAVHFINAPGTTPANDNSCCTYNQGCTDDTVPACNYDSLAFEDDGSCTYLIGCTDNTQDNYDGNATLPCYDDGGSVTILGSNGICVGQSDTGYSDLGDPAVFAILQAGTAPGINNCCCLYGCEDINAWNYDSNATCSNSTCEYYVYGCSDITAWPTSYDSSADGCSDPNGVTTHPGGPLALATGLDEHHCCIYDEPTWTYICANSNSADPYDPVNDDASNPPVDGWGDCTEILATDPLYTTMLNYENNFGVQLLFTSNVSLVDAAAACAAQCTGCDSIPTAGCSSCAAGAQGQPCGTYIDDEDAIEDAFDPTFAGSFLFFDNIDDCNSSTLCGLESLGCTDSDYCEYWTQAVEVDPTGNPGVYANAGSITLPSPTGTMIGILGPTVLANGCINAINPGCPLSGSTNYDPSATPTCPNPYDDSADPLYVNGILPSSWIDPFTGDALIDIPIQDIDWSSNSYQSVIDEECEFSCQDEVVNGLPTPGNPELVIDNGGSCWTCAGTVLSGQQIMAPCTEVDNITLYNQLMANSTYTLQWFNDDGDCDAGTFCGGNLGCSDDGSGNISLFTAGRDDAALNISPGWTTPGPPACNYDNDPTLAPDPTKCNYQCAACLDDGDPSNATPIRPNTFVGPAFNYEYDCDGNYVPIPLVPSVSGATGDSCCCYIEGCTDPAAPNYDPAACFDDGSCDNDIYGCTNTTSSNYNSSATVACNGNNGYPPNDYTAGGALPCDPADIGTDNCCCSDIGFDCVDNLCTPHVGSGSPEYVTLQQCKNEGCGDGRYKCQPYGKTKFDGSSASAVPEPEALAEQKVLPIGTEIQMDKDKYTNFVLNNEPNTPDKLDCCIPDPMGPHLTLEDCKQNSNCGDCDEIQWKCKRNGSTTTQSNDICVQTVDADPDCQNGTCYDTQNQCIASGCEHNRETWICKSDPPGKAEEPKNTLGEQNTGLTLVNVSQPCVQQGYFGWDTQAECHNNTECWVPSTNDTDPYCFIGSSKVKMFDGTEKRIDEIIEGDVVLNDEGTESRVVEVQKHVDFHDNIYGFNGEEPFVTAEHPLLVEGDIWKSIDPTWTPEEFSHDIERFQLEVGDKLIVGTNKEIKVVNSIDEHKLEVPVYNLELDVVNTYYVNEYVSHNAFFRDTRITEADVVGVGNDGWTPDGPGNPTGLCPCIVPAGTYDPACCLKGGGPPPPPGGVQCSDPCPNPSMFRCPIGYTWNPPTYGQGPNYTIPPQPCATGGAMACIHCTQDPNRLGCCLETGCDPTQPCNGTGNNIISGAPGCVEVWCGQ
jgi:hypothetical protein